MEQGKVESTSIPNIKDTTSIRIRMKRHDEDEVEVGEDGACDYWLALTTNLSEYSVRHGKATSRAWRGKRSASPAWRDESFKWLIARASGIHSPVFHGSKLFRRCPFVLLLGVYCIVYWRPPRAISYDTAQAVDGTALHKDSNTLRH